MGGEFLINGVPLKFVGVDGRAYGPAEDFSRLPASPSLHPSGANTRGPLIDLICSD